MRCVFASLITSCIAGAYLAANSASANVDQTRPTVSTSSLRLDFDAAGTLTQITDLANHHEFLAGPALALWRLVLSDGTEVLPDKAHAFNWKGGDDAPLELTWSQFELATESELKVIARVRADSQQPVCRWRIDVEGSGDCAVQTVQFPRIGPIRAQEHETLAVPQWIGEAMHKPRAVVNPGPGQAERREWSYPGVLSMQFITFYDAVGHGLLLSTNDTQVQRKRFAIFGDGANGLDLEVVHEVPVERDKRRRYSPPYEVVLETFQGDWFTAADLYRRWAQNQWWVKASRVRTAQTPGWVRDTAVWIWNRGPSSSVLQPAIAFQKAAQVPVSVFWHWWHGCAYDVGFPEYLPPREGTAAFRDAVTEAEAQGIHAIVYMNQRLWGMTTRSWTERGVAAYAVKRPDGMIQPEVYNTFVKAPCASMCMGTQFWRDTYAQLAESAVRDLHVAGIYMDQACSSLSCFDPAHGHPLGGGSYWMDGFKLLEEDIRRRTRDVRHVALAGEGCGEGWLPYLDLMLSLQVSLERYAAPSVWEPLPLFNAVYHDCATQYGNYSSLTRPPYDSLWPAEFAPKEPLALLDRKFATQFRLEQARSFIWGQQPTLANFRESQLTVRADEIGYFLKIARLRMASLKYLRDGVFLRPPEVQPHEAETPISRLSIYAGQQDAVQEYKKTVPLVLASAWRAKDGDVGIAVANIAETKAPLRITLNRSNYPLPLSGVVYRLTGHGRTKVATFGGGVLDLEITMGPCDVRIYEIADQ